MLTFFLLSAIAFGLVLPWLMLKLKRCPPKTKLIVRLYLDDLDCFEPLFERVAGLSSEADLELTVVDMLDTNQSRVWLIGLQEKYKIYFEITTKERS